MFDRTKEGFEGYFACYKPLVLLDRLSRKVCPDHLAETMKVAE